MVAVMERLAECARTALLAGYPVIVDAAFLPRAQLQVFQALAARRDVPFSILHCQAGEAVMRRRVAARSTDGVDASETDEQVLAHQLRQHEPIADDERTHVLEVCTESPVDVAALCRRWLSPSP